MAQERPECAEIVVRLGLGVIPVMVTATGVWGAREERVSSPGRVLDRFRTEHLAHHHQSQSSPRQGDRS